MADSNNTTPQTQAPRNVNCAEIPNASLPTQPSSSADGNSESPELFSRNISPRSRSRSPRSLGKYGTSVPRTPPLTPLVWAWCQCGQHWDFCFQELCDLRKGRSMQPCNHVYCPSHLTKFRAGNLVVEGCMCHPELLPIDGSLNHFY